jgi:hypothetical protein
MIDEFLKSLSEKEFHIIVEAVETAHPEVITSMTNMSLCTTEKIILALKQYTVKKKLTLEHDEKLLVELFKISLTLLYQSQFFLNDICYSEAICNNMNLIINIGHKINEYNGN